MKCTMLNKKFSKTGICVNVTQLEVQNTGYTTAQVVGKETRNHITVTSHSNFLKLQKVI